LLDPSKYKIVFPAQNNPVNAIYIYFMWDVLEAFTLTIVYLPFPVTPYDIPVMEIVDDKKEYSYTQALEYPKNGIIDIDVANEDKDNDMVHYGFTRDLFWIFSGGLKLPYDYLTDLNKSMVQINSSDNIDISDDLTIRNLIYQYTETIRDDINKLNDYETDKFNTQITEIVDELIDWGIDDYYVNTIKAIVDKDIPVEYKLILLRIYADHYVGNANKDGYTPPFELDDEYPNYPVLNANGRVEIDDGNTDNWTEDDHETGKETDEIDIDAEVKKNKHLYIG
jgi:hypothetical protein